MRILLLLVFLIPARELKAQSLRDSLFGGKLKTDTVTKAKLLKQDVAVDTVIFITADTSSAAREKNTKDWKKFIEMQFPVLLVLASDKKKGLPNGQFKAVLSFVVEADGAVTFIKTECDPQIDFLKPEFEIMLKKAPRLIPSHKGVIYVRTVRKVGITYTVEKREITSVFSLLTSLKE